MFIIDNFIYCKSVTKTNEKIGGELLLEMSWNINPLWTDGKIVRC